MHKRIAAALVLVSVSATLVAAEDFKFISGGLNLSSMSGDSPDNVYHKGYNLSYGYQTVLEQLEERIQIPLTLYTAVSFETRGQDMKESFNGLESKYGMHYLQFPVLAGWSFELRNLSVNVFLGPEIGFFLWRTVSIGVEEVDNKNLPEVFFVDLGTTIGTGVTFEGSAANFFLHAFYYRGLLNTLEDTETADFQMKGDDTKLRNIKLALGLQFPTKW